MSAGTHVASRISFPKFLFLSLLVSDSLDELSLSESFYVLSPFESFSSSSEILTLAINLFTSFIISLPNLFVNVTRREG